MRMKESTEVSTLARFVAELMQVGTEELRFTRGQLNWHHNCNAHMTSYVLKSLHLHSNYCTCFLVRYSMRTNAVGLSTFLELIVVFAVIIKIIK